MNKTITIEFTRDELKQLKSAIRERMDWLDRKYTTTGRETYDVRYNILGEAEDKVCDAYYKLKEGS